MKRNFDFLSTLADFTELYTYCYGAEANQKSAPNLSALNARYALDYTVKTIYLLQKWPIPAKESLFGLVDAEPFRQFINDPQLLMALHYIRKAGNNALHLETVTAKEAAFALLNLHTFVSAVLVKLGVVTKVAPFDASLLVDNKTIPTSPPKEAEPKKAVIDKYQPQFKQAKTLNAKNPQYFTEAETRKVYIDQQLRQAGWEVVDSKGVVYCAKACIEIEVSGMPSNSGVGYVDYVLFGRDRVPLALIEAKKTSKSPIEGKHQATLYADCLEKQYGTRPVIYYTNGYETYIIDGLGYPARLVYGFHNLEELLLLNQRKGRRHIADLTINNAIAGRAYQRQAITAVCEHFNKKHRRALLVMATGTGKTRVAISLVELLERNNWVKNALFLADRTTLVGQAHENFNKYLPSIDTYVLSDHLVKEKNINARMMFSTYHTMLNYIDSDAKAFSIGRFDLVIVDEAHRSIFGRFGTIFDYFDSLLVGLTATPREDIDRSTYQVFDMEQGVPNFSYELAEAVADGYLVPYTGLIRHSKHLRQGIKYDELAQDEKDQLEQVWQYETTINEVEAEEYSRDIINKELFSYIFNDNTIDKVLQDLMEHGFKVQSGERIGKTIIFAYNHKHAKQIVERFEKLYPEYGAGFCVLIDYSVNYAKDLINSFKVRDKDPQIAVSVDMLDTGVDIHDVLNLVFFKEVKSKIKFMQMIGRGTRLSEDIFGLGLDKQRFFIFDYCGNFEYFNVNPQGTEVKATLSLTARIFCLKVDIAFALQSIEYQEDEYARTFHDALKEELKAQIAGLNPLHINVKKNLRYVDKYKLADSWLCLSLSDVNELKTLIAPILSPSQEDESAKRFDLLILNIQLALLCDDKKAKNSTTTVSKAAHALSEKATIKEVRAKASIIKEVATEGFWPSATLDRLESIRIELRDLMKYLKDDVDNQTFTVNIDDTIEDAGEAEGIVCVRTYKQRVIDYLAEHADHPVITKIRNLERINQSDVLELEKILWKDLGTRDEYYELITKAGAGGNVAAFIRSIVGLDRKAAEACFSQFLATNMLNSEQQEYLKTIINYVNENGDITTEVLVNDTLFDAYDLQDIFGDYVALIPQYIEVIHSAIIAN